MADDVLSAPVQGQTRRYIAGIGLLLVVVVLWTTSNFATNILEAGVDAYDKPFFITYVNTSTFTLWLIPCYFRYRKQPERDQYEIIESEEGSPRTSRDTAKRIGSQDDSSQPSIGIRETAVIAAYWSVGWFLANFTITLSLAWTSVSSATILSATSGFFTLLLGSMFGVEKLNKLNIFAAVTSFIGVFLVAKSDSSLSDGSANLPSHPVWGDVAAVVSAACYGGYVVFAKIRLEDEQKADSQLMLGFAGLFQTVGLLPLIPILHFTGWERFQMPPTPLAWALCFINMGVTCFSDYFYVLAMLKTSPMLVTVGLSLTIPLALLISLFLPAISSSSITLTSLLGALLVLSAFVLLGREGWRRHDSEGEETIEPIET